MNKVRESWWIGAPALGTWLGWVGPLEAERVGASGYEWAVIDLEGSGLGWDALIGLIQAIELGGAQALVRVPSPSPTDVMRALDCGAVGVIVPMVNSAETAKAVAMACRYPPQGNRANGQLRRAYPSHAEANADIVCIAMLEARSALDEIEAIAATPGIDGLMLGQVDLALSMGWPLDADGGAHLLHHPDVRASLERMVQACSSSNKHASAAILGASDDELKQLLDMGITWLAHRDLPAKRAPLRQRLLGTSGNQNGEKR